MESELLVPKAPNSSFHHPVDISPLSSSSLSYASESNVKEDVIEALGEDGFEGIKNDWNKWENRKDLFDHVVMKSVEFIAGFINQVGNAKIPTLAALFIKRSDEVDQVLKKIKYGDYELRHLTDYRPELAEPKSHDKFFNVMDKIQKPGNQEMAVEWGVINLINAKKHDSVIPLINALEKRQVNGRNLNNVAIQQAFHQGAKRGIKYIVEELHEHLAITPVWYACGLLNSWDHDQLKTFPFLLTQADQGDLKKVKEVVMYKNNQEFRKAIDDTFESAPPVGTRYLRFFGRAKIAITTLNDVMDTGVWMQEPGSIIASYLLGEQEETNVMEKLKAMPEDVASYGIKQEEEQVEGEKGKCIIM